VRLEGRDVEVVQDPQTRVESWRKGEDEELVRTPSADKGAVNEPNLSKNMFDRGNVQNRRSQVKPDSPRTKQESHSSDSALHPFGTVDNLCNICSCRAFPAGALNSRVSHFKEVTTEGREHMLTRLNKTPQHGITIPMLRGFLERLAPNRVHRARARRKSRFVIAVCEYLVLR
jgi:hypothetical protein